MFLVGDAAGQCLPVSGEGIRPALVFGQAVGRLARDVVERRRDLDHALTAYRRLVLRRAGQYRLLELFQRSLLKSPQSLLRSAVWFYGTDPFAGPAQRAYWRVADPNTLRPYREGPPTTEPAVTQDADPSGFGGS